jgi:hypothetical protein
MAVWVVSDMELECFQEEAKARAMENQRKREEAEKEQQRIAAVDFQCSLPPELARSIFAFTHSRRLLARQRARTRSSRRALRCVFRLHRVHIGMSDEAFLCYVRRQRRLAKRFSAISLTLNPKP